MSNYSATLLPHSIAGTRRVDSWTPLNSVTVSTYSRASRLSSLVVAPGGPNQGLNLRDSGLNVAYARARKRLMKSALPGKARYRQRLQSGHLRRNDSHRRRGDESHPDKQHTSVVNAVMPLMKEGACLDYAHGFNS